MKKFFVLLAAIGTVILFPQDALAAQPGETIIEYTDPLAIFCVIVFGLSYLLVTLTCGVGGSLLSIGSAAGVALMGTSQGCYTFLSHLRWTPLIGLGYAAGIGTHFLVNS